jgi:hypothetical protein
VKTKTDVPEEKTCSKTDELGNTRSSISPEEMEELHKEIRVLQEQQQKVLRIVKRLGIPLD